MTNDIANDFIDFIDFKIQMIIFQKDKISLNNAFEWIVNNLFKIKNNYETETEYIFEQYGPTYLCSKGYFVCRHMILNDFVSLLVAFK